MADVLVRRFRLDVVSTCEKRFIFMTKLRDENSLQEVENKGLRVTIKSFASKAQLVALFCFHSVKLSSATVQVVVRKVSHKTRI